MAETAYMGVHFLNSMIFQKKIFEQNFKITNVELSNFKRSTLIDLIVAGPEHNKIFQKVQEYF